MAEYNTQKNTLLPVTLADRRVDGECSGDYILPDTVADIKRVLRVTPQIIPGSRYFDGSTLGFEGKAVYTAIIVTEENRLAKLTYEEEYSDSIEIDGISDDRQAHELIINIRPEAGALSWRIVNQRKLGIRLKLSTHVNVCEMRDVSPDLSALAPGEIQRDEVTLPSVCMYSATESGRLCEDVEIEGTLPQFGEIIDCRCELSVSECKCGEGSVMCRGEAMVSVLYTGDNGEPVFTVRHIPFMQPVALDAADLSSQALAYVCCETPIYEVKPNGYGEMRVLSLDLDYTVTAECAADKPVTLLRDVYSTERPAAASLTDVTLTRLERGYTTNFSVNASAARSDIGAADAERALDADVRVVIGDFRYDRERSRLILEGSADICVTCSHKCEDGVIEYSSHNFSAPVRCELEAGFAGSDTLSGDSLHFRCTSAVTMVRTRLDSSAVYCDFEVAMALFAVRRETVSTVSAAVICDGSSAGDALSVRDGGSFILCYPASGETLWDIAKRYRTACNSIADMNGFSDAERSPQFQVKKKYGVLLVSDGVRK